MKEEDNDLGKPPFFNNWKGMYLFVLINLALTILIFYLISIYYR
jgi:hypothetical protein